ncbi:MAG: hypothetical protein GY941_30615 [Planctomycetes bacterium]|nr:hypothetical protein [Planctomycetota bacterium]
MVTLLSSEHKQISLFHICHEYDKGTGKNNLKEEVGGFRVELRDVKEDVVSLKENVRDMRIDIKELKKGAFTKNEKDEVLNMVRNIDERLEEETLGRDKITFTRGEYDSVAKTSGFENRFEKIGK